MPPLSLTSPTVAARTLADYTRPGLLVPQLREHDTAGIIGELSQALQREGCIPDLLPFYHAALNQELLANSVVECGLAFPHARLNGVKHLRFALGRAPREVLWAAKGCWPVEFVFLLAVPATDAASYLHLLASLARLGQEPQLLSRLRRTESAAGMLAVLEQVKLHPS